MRLIEQGREHLANGELNRAIAAFWAATQHQPEPKAWYELGVSLALDGQWYDLLRVINGITTPVPYFQNICLALMELGEFEVLGQFHHNVPQSHITSPIACYYAGVSLIAANRYVESIPYFGEFKRVMVSNLTQYNFLALHDRNFNLIFRQGMLVETLDIVGALDEGASRWKHLIRNLFFIIRSRLADQSHYLLAASMISISTASPRR